MVDPASDEQLEGSASSPRPPRTDEERTIAKVWGELLDIADPPANVSFFELGGYSLGLMRVAAQLQEAFGLSIPVPDLFENITVEEQARLVERLYEQQLAEFME